MISDIMKKYAQYFYDGMFWKTAINKIHRLGTSDILRAGDVLLSIRDEYEEAGMNDDSKNDNGEVDLFVEFYDNKTGFLALTLIDIKRRTDTDAVEKIKLLKEWVQDRCPTEKESDDEVYADLFMETFGVLPSDIIEFHNRMKAKRIAN